METLIPSGYEKGKSIAEYNEEVCLWYLGIGSGWEIWGYLILSALFVDSIFLQCVHICKISLWEEETYLCTFLHENCAKLNGKSMIEHDPQPELIIMEHYIGVHTVQVLNCWRILDTFMVFK